MLYYDLKKYSQAINDGIMALQINKNTKSYINETFSQNNLKSNGISVTSLCSYSHIIFIALDNYYRGEYTERDDVTDLMKRLNGS